MSAIKLRGEFGSVAEFVHSALHDEPTPANKDHRMIAKARDGGFSDASWLGLPTVPTGAELEKLIADGWADGATRINDCLSRIDAPPAVCVRRRPVWGDAGETLDMDRVRSGNLDIAWRGFRRQSAIGPSPVRIVCQIGGMAGVDAEELFWRGAAALKLADVLTEAGYQVQIDAASHAELSAAGSPLTLELVTVKPYTAPFSMADAAAALALPAFFRVLTLLWRAKHHDQRVGGGISTTRKLTTDLLGSNPGERTVLLPVGAVTSQASAQAWVQRMVNEIQDTVANAA